MGWGPWNGGPCGCMCTWWAGGLKLRGKGAALAYGSICGSMHYAHSACALCHPFPQTQLPAVYDLPTWICS